MVFKIIKPIIGVKSNPPAGGINFLIGCKLFEETSSTICKRALELPGATQLKIIPPKMDQNIIVKAKKIT